VKEKTFNYLQELMALNKKYGAYIEESCGMVGYNVDGDDVWGSSIDGVSFVEDFTGDVVKSGDEYKPMEPPKTKPKNHRVNILEHDHLYQKAEYTCLDCGCHSVKELTQLHQLYDIFMHLDDEGELINMKCEACGD